MSVMHINEFGGILPSVQKRNLPGSAAQTAHNLDLRFGDFRPLRSPGASVTAVAAGVKSLFRTPSGVWLSSVNDVNYVNGQINDASFERVYLTGRSAYPEAWQDAAYRQLGVPTPGAAPGVAVTVNDEFTSGEAGTESDRLVGEVSTLAQAHDSAIDRGTAPTPSAPNTITSFDPFRDDVIWHLPMSTDWTDAGPKGRSFSASGGATISVPTDGPFASASKYGIFSGSGGVTTGNVMSKDAWTLDCRIRLAADMNSLTVKAGGYSDSIRFIQVNTVGPDYTLVRIADGYRLRDSMIVKRADAGVILPANTWGRLTIVSHGGGYNGRMSFWMNGVRFAETGWGKPLEISIIGDNLVGNLADLQWTNRARYAQGATFSPGTAALSIVGPPSEEAGATGYWLAHGTSTTPALPTGATRDYAYLGRMTGTDLGATMFNVNETYLQDPSLDGRAVVHGGSTWWAVPVRRVMASGLDLNTVSFAAALTAMTNGMTPPAPLFDAPTVTAVVADVDALYEASVAPSNALLADLQSAQLSLIRLVASNGASGNADTSKAATFADASRRVTSASDALTAYYADIDTYIRDVVSQKYGDEIADALPPQTEREIENRAYLSTWVSDRGEESGSSPSSILVEVDANDVTTVTVASPPGGRSIVGWRLYRSSTVNNSAAWQLVADKGAANAVLTDGEFDYFSTSGLSYIDDQRQGELQENCPTLTWAEPPADLKGLVGLPNGIMAGFFDKTLCFCEPFNFHAWPPEYQKPLEFRIVGLGVFGQTLVVLTEGHPYYFSGADSASMSGQKLESTQSCASKRTIASMEGGVVYASPDGLCLAGPGGVELMTQGAFEREDWQALDLPNCFGAFAEGVYHLFTPTT